jgi:two-component system chemotaxis response regulator CheB
VSELHKMPVIMCSSLTQRGARVTIEALACGASDYVAKPAGQSGREAATQALSQDLIPKIHALAGLPSSSPFPAAVPARLPFARPPLMMPVAPLFKPQPISSNPAVLVIGVSTGGPVALDQLPRCPPTSRSR